MPVTQNYKFRFRCDSECLNILYTNLIYSCPEINIIFALTDLIVPFYSDCILILFFRASLR